jgi:CheY-like chemotaxis protein
MSDQTVSNQLFHLTTQIILFDGDNFQQKILEEVSSIFDFKACATLNVVDYERMYLSHFTPFESGIHEDDFFQFLDNELYSWSVEQGPYIGSYGDWSVVGVAFQQQTWGVFLAEKHPLSHDVQALETFSNSVNIWYDYPHMFYSTEPPIKIDMLSERKYAALQTLYSIAEWEWDLNSNDCYISNAFIAFFDHATIQPCYSITDLYHLLGPENTQRFKECMDKAIHQRYQVFEEFKCPLLDQQTFQHIQMLFDPVYEGDHLVKVVGFCRDNGRTYASDQAQLKWFDSEWLHDLPLLPMEWIVHSNLECEITTSPFHHVQVKENIDQLMAELSKHLTDVFSVNQFDKSINLTIKFPFSKYHYQLIASKSELDPLLWRGFLILLNEKETVTHNTLQQKNYEQYNQQRVFQFFQSLSRVDTMSDYQPLIQYLLGLPRYSKESYTFHDFWSQIEELAVVKNGNATIQNGIVESFRVPHAQWILSLFSFVMTYFRLEHTAFRLHCVEPAIVESQNTFIMDANHVLQLSLTAKHIHHVPNLVALFLQFGLMGTSIDINFMFNDVDWKCNIYFEVKAPEQPLMINSKKVYQPVPNMKKKTVLIVDDDQYNTQTLEVLFHSDGFRTMSANHGQQALRLMDSVDGIDVIILDLRMPIMDGVGVLERMKERSNSIPVVVLSANITPNVSEQLRQYNVNAIIEKPFDMDELIGHVSQLIPKDSFNFQNNVTL